MALDKTLSELIQAAMLRMSMYPGTATQLYAEDRIAAEIQHVFDVLFDEAYWPQFSQWNTSALDGSSGVVTSDMTVIATRWDDVRSVLYENYTRPIPRLPSTINPYAIQGSTIPLYIEPIATNKIFRVWPLDATGNVRFYTRLKPADFSTNDTINFDSEALILGTVFGILEDDGTNPGATEKFQIKFEKRVMQLKKNLEQHARPLNMYTTDVPLDWMES